MELGTKVPNLLGLDQAGREVLRSDYAGQWIALYFYPKDNTAGCTKQACNLRDNYALLQQRGVAIVGVSRDGAASHQRFIEKQQLPFRLIVDSDNVLGEAFGTWVEKTLYGRRYMGTERTTFLISPEGEVRHILRGRAVKTGEHAEQILALLS